MEAPVPVDGSTGPEEADYNPPSTVAGVTTQALTHSQATPWTINAGASIAAMSASPSMSQVVVAGREVLKIYSTDTLGEALNIRFGRVNMHYASNDVRWNPNESHSNLIATAATNGHVVLWNLNLKGKKLGTYRPFPPSLPALTIPHGGFNLLRSLLADLPAITAHKFENKA